MTSRPPKRRGNRSDRFPVLERLEDRTLLSITFNFAGGLLDIQATADENNVFLSNDGSRVIVSGLLSGVLTAPGGSGSSGEVLLSDVTAGIRLTGDAGNNSFFIDNNNTEFRSRGIAITLVGGEGNDSLQAGQTRDDDLPGVVLDGGPGIDQIFGARGGDTILGGDGDDVLSGGTGNDSIDGGPGNDSVGGAIFGGPGNDTILGGPGNDLIFGDTGFPGPDDGDDSIDGGTGDDSVQGDGGNDTLVGAGAAENDRLVTSGDASFTLTDAQLIGFGTDSISGFFDACFELLGGGANSNAPCRPPVLSLVASRDTAIAAAVSEARVLGFTRGGGNSVDAGGFTGKLQVYGDAGDNLIQGGAGSTFLIGAEGNDTLIGGPAADILDGGPDNDSLVGGAGNDTLIGGTGTNQLDGGPGCDNMDGSSESSSCAAGAEPTIRLSSPMFTVGESDGTATITVELTAASLQTVTVRYAASKGSAKPTADFTTIKGTLTFAPGETTKTFNVQIRNDTTAESDETIKIKLSKPKGARLSLPSSGLLTIIDDDAVVAAAIGTTTVPPLGTAPLNNLWARDDLRLRSIILAIDTLLERTSVLGG
jgi:Ca2+-binding RTX toxin-like protein